MDRGDEVAMCEVISCQSSGVNSLLIKSEERAGVRKARPGVPIVAQWVKNWTSIHEDAGSFPGLAQWVKDLALPRAVV